jgi:hypothetical protein
MHLQGACQEKRYFGFSANIAISSPRAIISSLSRWRQSVLFDQCRLDLLSCIAFSHQPVNESLWNPSSNPVQDAPQGVPVFATGLSWMISARFLNRGTVVMVSALSRFCVQSVYRMVKASTNSPSLSVLSLL